MRPTIAPVCASLTIIPNVPTEVALLKLVIERPPFSGLVLALFNAEAGPRRSPQPSLHESGSSLPTSLTSVLTIEPFKSKSVGRTSSSGISERGFLVSIP